MEGNNLNEIHKVRDSTLMLIGEACTEDAIALLKDFLKEKDKELYVQLLLISNQFFEVKKEKLLGLGSKGKKINRINYNLIIFVNNLEFSLVEEKNKLIEELPNKVKNRNIPILKSTITILAVSVVFWIINQFMSNAVEKKIPIVSGKIAYDASVSTNINKKSKIFLKYKSKELNRIDTIEYYVSSKLKDIKEDIINTYNLDSLMKSLVSYSSHGMQQNKKWVIKCGITSISDEEELLTIESLILNNKIHEFDEISLRQEISLSRIAFAEPKIYFTRMGSYNIALTNEPKISFTQMGSYNIALTSETALSFYIPFKESKISSPVNRNSEKKKSRNFNLINKYGLKPKDEIYILSEEEEDE